MKLTLAGLLNQRVDRMKGAEESKLWQLTGLCFAAQKVDNVDN